LLSGDDSDRIPRKKLEVRNPSVGEGRLGPREADVGLVGGGILDDEDEDKYTPLPTPTRVQFPIDEPHFEPPRGRTARSRAVHNLTSRPLPKDILPAHPRQIMSPPLESQMYFSPMLATDMGVSEKRHTGLASPPARVRASVKPKSRASNSREKSGERDRGIKDFYSGGTTTPLRIAAEKAESGRQYGDGASKGKGKLVKANPSARAGRLAKGGE
jgi:hypothetical protein